MMIKPRAAEGDGHEVTFSRKMWAGMAALALTPAGGFAGWAFQMHSRMAVVETIQQQVNVNGELTREMVAKNQESSEKRYEQLLTKLDAMVRVEERLLTLSDRVQKMEAKIDQQRP